MSGSAKTFRYLYTKKLTPLAARPCHALDRTFGNSGVGILEGPATASFSMSIGKHFALKERIGFHWEAQFANLFDWACSGPLR